MLSQISWTLFLIAVFVVLVLYYSFIAICYYPKEVLTFLFGKKNYLQPHAALGHAGPLREHIMGPVQQQLRAEEYLNRYRPQTTPAPEAVTAPAYSPEMPGTGSDEETLFMVASDITETPVIEVTCKDLSPDALLTSHVSDQMESARTLLRVIRDGAGDRNDIISFFPSLLAQYPNVSESKYRYAINQFIRDNCQQTLREELTLEDINELWCFPYPPQAA